MILICSVVYYIFLLSKTYSVELKLLFKGDILLYIHVNVVFIIDFKKDRE